MVSTLTEGHIEWTMAAPLWPSIGSPSDSSERLRFRTPTILRFTTDTFMDDFHNLLAVQPSRLNEYVAAPETWTSPPNDPVAPLEKQGLALVLQRARDRAVKRLEARGTRVIGAAAIISGPATVLKLFQPVHQRYYLVTTCLVCRMLGLPDRSIDAGAQERATFVLRLLQPRPNASKTNPDPRDCDELALVQGKWQVLSDPENLPAGEEQHALSPASYVEEDLRTRRLLIGLIPVGDRERLLQAVQPNPAGAPTLPDLVDARDILLKMQVIGPLSNLETLANDTLTSTQVRPGMPPLTGDQESVRQAAIPGILARANNQIQQISFYILLDLARYFESNINDLWQAIHNGNASAVQDPVKKQVWNTLQSIRFGANTMIDALRIAYDSSLALDAMRTVYPNPDGANQWPSLQFPFYTVTSTSVQSLTGLSTQDDRKAFDDQIVAALVKPSPNPFPQRVVAQANANPQGVTWFTIRCILERPNCGALTRPLVSEPTAAFQLAAFFDPDAPARPIRIGLPIDTTPAGLRKFDRNTAFVMSDTLCGQVSKMSGMSFADLVLSVLPWPLHQDLGGGGGKPCGPPGVAWGMVCSFSIPIITIVALILLIIFVKLLDIIFFWIPFFQICLPLPKFSAKDS
jgi:hypothetical protein